MCPDAKTTSSDDSVFFVRTIKRAIKKRGVKAVAKRLEVSPKLVEGYANETVRPL